MTTIEFPARATAALILLASAALAIACYVPGLSGGFLLDDYPNFEPIHRWLAGDISAQAVIFGNGSGPSGRPLSMASFMLSAAASGVDPSAFKAGNLALHLLNGVLLALLFARIAPPGRPRWQAALAAGCWLLLPIHVSTVLYAVQRMAILATTFSLLALLAYVQGRAAMRDGRERAALAWLFIAVPVATLLAVHAKETGVLVPLLALAIEVTVLANWRRTRSVAVFHACAVGLPLLAAIALLALRPDAVLGGYNLRDFTVGERILTEGRVLWAYARQVLAPNLPALGLLHDDYAVSRSLFEPPWTAIALLGLVAIAALAIALRRRWSLAAFGVLFFLAAHALESTLLPLDLYFEHRNYLAAAGLVALVWDLLARMSDRATRGVRATLLVALGAILATYALGTWARAGSWSSFDAWLDHEAARAPSSPRIRAMQAMRAVEIGNAAGAIDHVDALEAALPESLAPRADALRLLAYCMVDQAAPVEALRRATSRAPSVIGPDGVNAYAMLAKRVAAGECPTMDADAVVAMARGWLAGSHEPPTSVNAWRLEFHAAEIEAERGRVAAATVLTSSAWEHSGHNAGVGVVLFRLLATAGRLDDARAVLAIMEQRADPSDRALRNHIDAFRAFLAQAPGATRAPPADEPR